MEFSRCNTDDFRELPTPDEDPMPQITGRKAESSRHFRRSLTEPSPAPLAAGSQQVQPGPTTGARDPVIYCLEDTDCTHKHTCGQTPKNEPPNPRRLKLKRPEGSWTLAERTAGKKKALAFQFFKTDSIPIGNHPSFVIWIFSAK